MKRRSYRYIFYFNVFFFLLIFIASLSFILPKKQEHAEIPASITTPLLYSESVSGNFCERAKSAVLIDAKSGAVLYEKNANARLAMASTTKIMTALAVLENAEPSDIITVSKKAVGIEGSSIYLKENEKLSVIDLLYGLLLESGNDAATALAIGVFGSEEECVEYMNQKCHSLGLIDTSFENVHGLDGKNHYTTAYELSLIAKEAMNNDVFRRIVGSKNYTTTGENPRYFSNHNRLLGSFENAAGIKTGYTSKSGRCLVSAAKKDGEEYIAVTLNDPLDWQDHKDMLSFAMDNFDNVEIADTDNFCIICDFGIYYPNDRVYMTVSGNADFRLDYKITLDKDVGKVEYYVDGKILGSFGVLRSE